jgi:hypothetical protein
MISKKSDLILQFFMLYIRYIQLLFLKNMEKSPENSFFEFFINSMSPNQHLAAIVLGPAQNVMGTSPFQRARQE